MAYGGQTNYFQMRERKMKKKRFSDAGEEDERTRKRGKIINGL